MLEGIANFARRFAAAIAVCTIALFVPGSCGKDTASSSKSGTTTAPSLSRVISAADADAVPAAVTAGLSGPTHATRLITARTMPLHDCTAGRLTPEPVTVSTGWVVPHRGLAAFVTDGSTRGVCDVAIANRAAALCGGAPERFADDAARLEVSGGQLNVCAQGGTNLAFLSVVVPQNAAWLAVQQRTGWDVYKVGDRSIVRVIATEGLNETGDRLSLRAKVLDASGRLIDDRTLVGTVAG